MSDCEEMTSWAAVCKKLFLGYRPHRFHDWLLWSVLDEILSCLVRTAFRVFSMVSTFSDRWWTHTCAHTLLQAADCRVWHYQPRQSECVRFFLLRWCWMTNHKPFKCCKVNVWLKKKSFKQSWVLFSSCHLQMLLHAVWWLPLKAALLLWSLRSCF